MARVLHWTLVVIAVLTPLLLFVEWLIGTKGEKAAKARLKAWYTYVKKGGLAFLVQDAARSTGGFLDYVLGPKPISRRAVLRWFLAAQALGITTGLLLIPLFWPDINNLAFVWRVIFCAITEFLLFPVDFLLLYCSRRLFDRIKDARGIAPGLWYVAYVYVTLALCCFITVYIMAAFNAHRLLDARILAWTLLRGLEWPYVIWAYPVTLFFIIPLMLSTILFSAVILGALLMQAFRPILEPVVLPVIKGLARSKKGVMSAIAAVLTSVTTLLVALTSK